MAGYFESTSVTFGSYTLNNAMPDTADMFLVKYDANGNVLWAKSAGGINTDIATSVTVDPSGNVLVTGTFSSDSIVFGSYTLTNTTTANYGDVFLVKYDTGGNVLWARSAGGRYQDEATSVDTDTLGNIAVSGFFLADSMIVGPDTLLNSGNYDMFVAKYDAGGNALWARRAGGSNDDRGYAVTTDLAGNVIVAGAFLSGSIIIGTDTLNYAGGAYTDIFLAKYNANGNPVWAESAGGTYLDEPNSVTTDASGNIYMTGIVYSSSIIIGTDTLANSGSSFYCEMFIAKYDAGGNPIWADNAGAPSNNDIAYSVAADVAGNVYVSGVYGNPITFGTVTLSGGGIFVVKYDGTGTALWAIGVPGGGGNGIVLDASGDIYVAGSIYSATITFGSTTLNNAGQYDMYVAKLSISTGTAETGSVPVCMVYPNPFSQYATLQFENPQHIPCTLRLFDSKGRLVRTTTNITTEKTEIDRADLSSGLYFFQLQDGNKVRASGKLLVE
ncbi:MAG: hypothetical protein FD123_3686 [Bacteroidetes bacterium]|nr:MAG: hypothetical protein FD123_3686 [Bacteroidota bacterium]